MRKRWMVFAAMLTGCATQAPVANDDAATRAGQVGMREISGTLAEASRVTLADNESFLVPVEDDANALPAYPGELLSKALPPQAVCMHFAVDVKARDPMEGPEQERLCTHCIIVFVALDAVEGKPTPVPPWTPVNDDDKRLGEYALKVMELSKGIEQTVERLSAVNDTA